MSYKTEELIGVQKPRISLEPDFLYSDGQDASELVSAYGMKPDVWQDNILKCWLGRDEADRFTSTSCGLSVPRQNGKNALLEMRELYGLCAIAEQILHTAHRVDTARKAFLRLASFFENPKYPELTEMVVNIRRTNGQEAILLTNGASIEFSSRVNGGARGSTYDVVIFDEAQELNDDQMEAIMSTMAAAPLQNRQQIFVGTPPSPVSNGTVFRRERSAALRKESNLCWHEWSVEEIGDVADKTRWYETNPALGIRLEESFTNAELSTLSKDGFARERLGFWSEVDKTNEKVFSEDEWDACYKPLNELEGEVIKQAFGVKFDSDGIHVALSVAEKYNDGIFIECIDYKPVINGGMASLANWLLDRKDTCASLIIDGKSNTAALYQRLLEANFPKKALSIANSNVAISAASMLKDAILSKEVFHANQPSLRDSAIFSKKRPIGNNGGWGFGDANHPSALIESAALAHFAVKTTKRKPGRKVKLL